MKKLFMCTIFFLIIILLLKVNSFINITKEDCINGNADLYECMQHKEIFSLIEYEKLLENEQLYLSKNKNEEILIERVLIKNLNNKKIDKYLIDKLKKCSEKNENCASFFKKNEFKLDKNTKLEESDFGGSLGNHIDGYAK